MIRELAAKTWDNRQYENFSISSNRNVLILENSQYIVSEN